MPVMAIYRSSGVSPEEYAAFRAKLPLVAAPRGALVHAHGATDEGFVTIEVWEDAESLHRFVDEVLAPTARSMGHPVVRPEVIEVDDFVVTEGVHDREIPYGRLAPA